MTLCYRGGTVVPHKHQKGKITIVMLETVVARPDERARRLDRASWYAWHTHQAASRFHHRKSPNSTGEITLFSCPRRRCAPSPTPPSRSRARRASSRTPSQKAAREAARLRAPHVDGRTARATSRVLRRRITYGEYRWAARVSERSVHGGAARARRAERSPHGEARRMRRRRVIICNFAFFVILPF